MRILVFPRESRRNSAYLRNLCNLMYLTPLDYTAADLGKIIDPALVLVGDRDEFVAVEEALEMHRMLSKGELVVAPNASHMFPSRNPELFAALVLPFMLRQS